MCRKPKTFHFSFVGCMRNVQNHESSRAIREICIITALVSTAHTKSN